MGLSDLFRSVVDTPLVLLLLGGLTVLVSSCRAAEPGATLTLDVLRPAGPVEKRLLGHTQPTAKGPSTDWREPVAGETVPSVWGKDLWRMYAVGAHYSMRGEGPNRYRMVLELEQMDAWQELWTKTGCDGVLQGLVRGEKEAIVNFYRKRVSRMMENVEKRGMKRVRYWEVGNEPDADFRQSGSGEEANLIRYPKWKENYIAAYQTIKSIDPTAQVGPNFDEVNSSFLLRQSLNDPEVPFDFVSFHQYFMLDTSSPVAAEEVLTRPMYDTRSRRLRAMIDTARPNLHIPIMITEWNFAGKPVSDLNKLSHAFGVTRFILGQANPEFRIAMMHLYLFASQADGPWAITRWDDPRLVRPAFFAYQMLTEVWDGELYLPGQGIVGDLPRTLDVAATRDPKSGRTSLIVLNLSNDKPQTIRWTLAGATPTDGTATVKTIDGGPEATLISQFQLEPEKESLIRVLDDAHVGETFEYTFGPHSMTTLTFHATSARRATNLFGTVNSTEDDFPGVLKVRARRLKKPPVIDGKGGDACWKEAEALSAFVKIGSTVPAEADSEVRVAYDDENLYLLFRLNDPRAKISRGPSKTVREGGGVMTCDGFEFFVSPVALTFPYYHFAGSPNGARFEEFHRDNSWNCKWEMQAQVLKGKAIIFEMRIPLEAIDLKGVKKGRVAGVNFCRNRTVPSDRYTQWSPTYFAFHDPMSFGILVFD